MADPWLLPLGAVLLGWVVAGGSPGPATLTISGTAMAHGRRAGVTVAAGVICGSAIWGIAAGLGLSALMVSHSWIMEVVRLAGAIYLLWLALKSARHACCPRPTPLAQIAHNRLFLKGLALHLTNPKAILSWGAVYAVCLVPGAGAGSIWMLFVTLILASMVVFFGYGLIFSIPRIARGYRAAQRWFELAFGLLFGAASVRILTARLGTEAQ